MVLGLYYLTKGKPSTKDDPVKGEGKEFFGPGEVIIALNEGEINKHSIIKVRTKIKNEEGELEDQLVETVAGRVIFNQFVPEEVGFNNELLTKEKNFSRSFQGFTRNQALPKHLPSLMISKTLDLKTPTKEDLPSVLERLLSQM